MLEDYRYFRGEIQALLRDLYWLYVIVYFVEVDVCDISYLYHHLFVFQELMKTDKKFALFVRVSNM